jgi:hypothetical protein
VYFTHTGVGVAKISRDGILTYIHKAVDGHWMCLDEKGNFSTAQPTYFERITRDGAKPAILYAGGGSPIAIGADGNLYYCGGQHGDPHPGAKTLVRESPQKGQTFFSPNLEDTLNALHDGITAIAAAPDGGVYVACWNSLLRVTTEGNVTTLAHPFVVPDCDEDPADHNTANRGIPLLRGIAVDSSGVVYVTATSCHRVVKITPDGRLETIVKSERPWSPTGVALRNGALYVLEYTHANGPATEGWVPRVRIREKNGAMITIADLSQKK